MHIHYYTKLFMKWPKTIHGLCFSSIHTTLQYYPWNETIDKILFRQMLKLYTLSLAKQYKSFEFLKIQMNLTQHVSYLCNISICWIALIGGPEAEAGETVFRIDSSSIELWRLTHRRTSFHLNDTIWLGKDWAQTINGFTRVSSLVCWLGIGAC